ncbi:unnamed protein product [Dicrocoelium dendriticum]|nr:unnamed protein product [Dicrocoelium dendriticum]
MFGLTTTSNGYQEGIQSLYNLSGIQAFKSIHGGDVTEYSVIAVSEHCRMLIVCQWYSRQSSDVLRLLFSICKYTE